MPLRVGSNRHQMRHIRLGLAGEDQHVDRQIHRLAVDLDKRISRFTSELVEVAEAKADHQNLAAFQHRGRFDHRVALPSEGRFAAPPIASGFACLSLRDILPRFTPSLVGWFVPGLSSPARWRVAVPTAHGLTSGLDFLIALTAFSKIAGIADLHLDSSMLQDEQRKRNRVSARQRQPSDRLGEIETHHRGAVRRVVVAKGDVDAALVVRAKLAVREVAGRPWLGLLHHCALCRSKIGLVISSSLTGISSKTDLTNTFSACARIRSVARRFNSPVSLSVRNMPASHIEVRSASAALCTSAPFPARKGRSCSMRSSEARLHSAMAASSSSVN